MAFFADSSIGYSFILLALPFYSLSVEYFILINGKTYSAVSHVKSFGKRQLITPTDSPVFIKKTAEDILIKLNIKIFKFNELS